MKLKIIHLTNFRCFQNFSLELDPKLTVLVGKNGAGKTAILDAISIGLGAFITRIPGVSGKDFASGDIRVIGDEKLEPYVRVAIESRDNILWDRTKRRDLTKDTRNKISSGEGVKSLNNHVDNYINSYNHGAQFQLPIFAYYGTGRGVFDAPKRRRDFLTKFNRFDAYKDTLDARADFRQFFKYFYFLGQLEIEQKIVRKDFGYELPQLGTIRRAITNAIPSISNPRIKQNPLRFLVDWDDEGEVSTRRIEQLSDGYRITVAMVADIASRMAAANPDMVDPLETEGVVIIDEVELHLHPQLQREIISILQNIFPNVQYICTTHSAPVVSHIDQGTVFILENIENNVVANKVHTYGHDTNYLLERVFETNKNPLEIQELIDKCARAIDLDQFSQANVNLSELIEKIGDDNPEVIYLRGLIEFLSD